MGLCRRGLRPIAGQTAVEPTLSVERIAVVVVSGRELEENVRLSRLHLVELERRHVAPDAERTEYRTSRLHVVEIRREVENPGRA